MILVTDGAVYRNNETRQIVIAHCGTDASVFANLRADLQIACGRVPVAYQFVAEFSAGIHTDYRDSGDEITETDHSLGAIYAELNAIRFRCKAVTFESPGSRDLIAGPPAEIDIITYLSAPNFINTSGYSLPSTNISTGCPLQQPERKGGRLCLQEL